MNGCRQDISDRCDKGFHPLNMPS